MAVIAVQMSVSHLIKLSQNACKPARIAAGSPKIASKSFLSHSHSFDSQSSPAGAVAPAIAPVLIIIPSLTFAKSFTC
uniref:Uncharacterized protein n=1 Tax=Streptococcus suis TaxID=1307 RepID=A0A2H4I6W4_STRSU|nr:hypothetical protein [Streptococcus suis]